MPKNCSAIFPIAPNGTICVIEPRGSMPVQTDYAGSVSRFIAAHDLTPREGRIVELFSQVIQLMKLRESCA